MITEPFEKYLAREGVNFSKVKEIARSPRHFRWAMDNERPDTKSLLIGRGAHCAILEPDRFPLDYAVFKGARRQGKAWDDFMAANSDRSILRADEYDACLAMRDAVRAHPVASKILERGVVEQSITWKDPLTGLGCKGRIDHADLEEEVLDDLKTTVNLDPPFFAGRVARYLYHVQLAWYIDGLRESDGVEIQKARIIAVESTPPYDVGVFVLDEDAIWNGHNTALRFLQTISACMASGEWPGRLATEERVLELPAWAFPVEEGDEEAYGLTVNGQEV